ncbi:MAG TPA: hypothetical protein VM238_04795 [Phycisphaerae bacterium]|nr:hypothetical protein [Phycisphaerae bacterium]
MTILLLAIAIVTTATAVRWRLQRREHDHGYMAEAWLFDWHRLESVHKRKGLR